MASDMVCFALKLNKDTQKYEKVGKNFLPFKQLQSYEFFAFLGCAQRNYVGMLPFVGLHQVVEPDTAFPGLDVLRGIWEFDKKVGDAVNPGWVNFQDLVLHDYGAIAPGVDPMHPRLNHLTLSGRPPTYRQVLGPGYFRELTQLARMGTERLVFWFRTR